MDINKDPDAAPEQTARSCVENDRVGEIIRNERERRGISIFVIAKDLRLNPRFIEALEANNYDQLPGDTYIRVYLRSLCKCFSLNAEEILERFFNERGLCGVDTLRKDSRTKINIAALREKEKPNKTVIIAVSITIIFAFFIFIGARQGWFTSQATPVVTDKPDSTRVDSTGADSLFGSIPGPSDTLVPDSLLSDSFADTGSAVSLDFIKESSILADAKKKSVKDSIIKVEAKVKAFKDSILKAEARNKVVKDSILKAEARNKVVKDSVLKAEARNKVVKDSVLKAEARNKVVKDSILKAEARNKVVKDSTLKAEARNKVVKDSILKAEAKKNIATDSARKAEEKSRLILEEIQKAQAKAKIIKDSILKAEAKNKAAKDSAQKAAQKNKSMPGAVANGQTLVLKVEVTGNSAWARILSDGVPWRNIMKKGAVLTFKAKDSFNLRTGQLEDVVYTLNGKKIDLPAGGIIALKIDRGGVTVVTDEKWFKLTKGRF